MKKLLVLASLALASLANAGPWDFNTYQYAGDGATIIGRLTPLPSGSVSGIVIYDYPTNLPKLATVDSSFSWYSGQVIGLSASKNAEIAGKYTAPVGTTAQYLRGDGSLATMPTVKVSQCIRATTAAGGTYTFTYPTAFAANPIINIDVEDSSTDTITPKITAVSTTATSIALSRTSAVTILGISVLGVASNVATVVHICATQA